MNYQRITFNDGSTTYNIGYTEWINFDYSGNVQSIVIPRAKGVKIWNTDELGGGVLTLRIGAFVIKSNRLEVEQYLYNLINNLANKRGTLTVENTLVLDNCCITDLHSDSSSDRWNHFTINFTRSL